ncbi:uncharacterized protein LOC128990344 [Macrosteles quadrilineatus]|uniref:uncharacterized protein LOC128990344 n=1 Tax=Macrosteles quadrilineatus TaxID=74068 RepID=UPI0023E34509|nr:uncharacterized protein LOC128990344 [Macrosteles quadrilineatus]
MVLQLKKLSLLLLMLNLFSLQSPLPVSNPEVSLNVNLESPSSKFKDTEKTSENEKSMKQDKYELENQRCPPMKNIGVNKRLVNEYGDDVEKIQYYKPINEEAKENIPVAQSRNDHTKNELGKQVKSTNSNPVNAVVGRPLRASIIVNGNGNSEEEEEANTFTDHSQTSNRLRKETDGKGDVQRFDSFQRIERSDRQKSVESHGLSNEALNTIKKINPFTIGDQVAQMIRNQKCCLKEGVKEKSTSSRVSSNLQHEDPVGFQQERDEILKQPLANEEKQHSYEAQLVYDKQHPSKKLAHNDQRSGNNKKPSSHEQKQFYDIQQPPRIVHKPNPSNDYGFSVIIKAGESLNSEIGKATKELEIDGVKLKDKVKATNVDGKNEFKEQREVDSNNTDSNEESFHSKGLWIEKSPNANVGFPVYDQDLAFEPDPFNGLLDQNYLTNTINNVSMLYNGPSAIPFHKIQARAVQKNSERHNKQTSKDGNGNVTPFADVKRSKNKTQKTFLSKITTKVPTPSKLTTTTLEEFDLDDTTSEVSTFSSSSSLEDDSSDIEQFSDLKIDLNKTSCISYKEPGKNLNSTRINYEENKC